MTERIPLARWIVRGLLLFTLTFANLNVIWSPDVVPNALFAWTAIREGDVDYDEFVLDQDPLALPAAGKIARAAYFFRACGPARPLPSVAELRRVELATPRSPGGPPPPERSDPVCSIFPPGIGLLALPVIAPFVLGGASADDGTLVVQTGHVAAAAFETIAVLLLWSVMRRFASARWALALVLLYWLGTSVRTISSQALWQHAGVHLALAIALWLTLHERVSIRRELVAGIVMGFGVTIRQTTAVIAVGLARLPWPPIAMVRLSAPALFAIGVVIGAVPLLVYNAIAFGSPFEQGYGDKPFQMHSFWSGLYGLLVSPSRGVLIYEPWIVFAFAAFALAWTRTGLIALRLRGLSISWAALLLLYAGYLEWWGGRVFGPRFLDDLAPALVVAIAWGVSQGLMSHAWRRVAFWVTAAWSLVLFNVAALVYDPNKWDTVPVNVNFDPSKLFDWADPQWLFVLRSLGSADARVPAAAVLSALLLLLLLRLELRARPLPSS